jgi:chromosome segregation ATPase
MVKVFIVIVLVIASFLGGVYFERYDSGKVGKLKNQLEASRVEANNLETQNQNLKQTLQLVKRQIQADRIAYQALQNIVESASGEREALKQKIEAQRELLQRLRDKLDQSG